MAVAALGAVPAVAVAGVLGVVAAAGVRSALGAGGWMLQRAFGPKPERSPVAMGEARTPETPQSVGGGELLQQRVQQLAEGGVAPVRVELAPEARELLGQGVGLNQGQPNLLDEAVRKAAEVAAQEEAAAEATRAGFGQRLKEGVRGY
jgi:hypothetical protein